jgi:hypothetical protein
MDSIPEDSPPPAPPAPPPARMRVLSRSVSFAREMPRVDVPPAPVPEVRSARTPAQPELRVL